MCNQTVSLIAAELERNGISTVCLQFLRSVAESVGPPRALLVPWPHGFALGRPGDAALQHRVIEASLRLLENPEAVSPLLEDYDASV